MVKRQIVKFSKFKIFLLEMFEKYNELWFKN